MQNTRLTTLVDTLVDRSTGWLRNPWRRLSILIINLLFGNFLASVVVTTTGQAARVDGLVAVILAVMVEITIWLGHDLGRPRLVDGRDRSFVLWRELLNGIRIGFIYGISLLALTLGS